MKKRSSSSKVKRQNELRTYTYINACKPKRGTPILGDVPPDFAQLVSRPTLPVMPCPDLPYPYIRTLTLPAPVRSQSVSLPASHTLVSCTLALYPVAH